MKIKFRSAMIKFPLLAACIVFSALHARAGDYTVTHHDPSRVFPGVTLLADMSAPRSPKVVEVDFTGKIEGERNHEPEMSGNGLMLVALRRPNRFVEFDLVTQKIVWSWSHPDGEQELDLNRDVNRLPNGNTLGTAGNKIIEIAPDGSIVWQMIAPGGAGNPRKFHKAIRRGPDGKAYGG